MREEFATILGLFQNLKVAVIGDAILDRYLEGETTRLCREAPVPVLSLQKVSEVAGGAANTAANLAALGADVLLLSIVGSDASATVLEQCLRRAGVESHFIKDRRRRTVTKTRLVCGKQLLLRTDDGSFNKVDSAVDNRFGRLLSRHLPECHAAIVSDYGCGSLTDRTLEILKGLREKYCFKLAVDSRKRLKHLSILTPDLAKPNFEEALGVLGKQSQSVTKRAEFIKQEGRQLKKLTKASTLAVTIDRDGALIFDGDSEPYRTYSRPVNQSRAAGAGDTFLAAMLLSLVCGAEPYASAEIANAASAVVIAQDGTSVCTLSELKLQLSEAGKVLECEEALAARANFYRRQGKRLVFTNGCFDILHAGSITCLHKAKELGDVLFVGVNCDESVTKIKGTGRPINTLEDRIKILSAIDCIDHIVPFRDDTACQIAAAVRPDIFVKGGDYSERELPEAPVVKKLGGRVVILPLLKPYSTDSIIEKIKRHAISAYPLHGENAAFLENRHDIN